MNQQTYYEVALSKALDIFEDKEKASAWLERDNRYLGCKPISLLNSNEGLTSVLEALSRIEYGIIS